LSFDKDYASACSQTRLISCTPRNDFLAYAGAGRTATRLFTSESRSMAGLELRMPSVSASVDCTSLMWRGRQAVISKARVIILGIPVVIYFMET
jgi:hypothetical protein